MTYFTSDGCSYDGIDSEAIVKLRRELGLDTTFVDEDTYRVIVKAMEKIR